MARGGGSALRPAGSLCGSLALVAAGRLSWSAACDILFPDHVPCMQGGFLTTGLGGKSCDLFLKLEKLTVVGKMR